MTINLIVDIVGWIGAGALLLAYGLVSAERLPGKSKTFQLLNLIGALGLMVNGGYYGAFPSVFVNVVWSFIALFTIAKVRKQTANTNAHG